MTRLLITGSRACSQAMIDRAVKAVERAKELGWSIIVGDADGIDAAAIEACDRLSVPVSVWGAYNTLKRRTKTGQNNTISGGYLERDRVMAERCDKVLAIWNGESRGTKYTYSYARRLGKDVWVIAEKDEAT